MAIVLTRSADGSLTLPAELLDGPQNAKYAIRSEGGTLVLTPLEELEESPRDAPALDAEWDAWFQRFTELSERIGAVWPEGLSAVDAVNAIRR
ncbi:MAG TPA: hypothetical protein VGM51_01150 [Armatimonadota bacterium]|jgi:hypothetical protein